ncbi:hypothetical protein H0H81_012204, partial [Sphagnurus paluster]
MGPTRTPKTSRQGEPSSSSAIAGPSKSRPPRRHHAPREHHATSSVPGVQKIKSALRQTRRLLAKFQLPQDKLAADVRVATERRLKTLEADLAQAEASKKERDIAVRYHKVKFFGVSNSLFPIYHSVFTKITERQKVVRKLNQTKKRLQSADTSSKQQIEAALAELRVDLNYILHYPKTKKYISLFPPEIREATSETSMPKVNPNSEDVRSWIRGQMQSGAISSEPELHLDSRAQDKTKGTGWEDRTLKKAAAA